MLLLVNPWIYDFAAFDMWADPLGLLSLAAVLEKAGYELEYIDCTSRFHPSIAEKAQKEKPFHTGKYYSEIIKKPEIIKFVPRHFRRYGIPEEAFIAELENMKNPSAILVTSRMTYWYPGVKRCIEIVKEKFPGAPVILGGTYATLMPEHAREVSKPDFVIEGEAETSIFEILTKIDIHPEKKTEKSETGLKDFNNLDYLPFPAWRLMDDTRALPLETSRGCPFSCYYCASRLIIKKYRKKSPSRLVDEIQFATEQLGTEDFAFYDDALLFKSEEHFEKIADEMIGRGIKTRFHLPNSVFAGEITASTAEKMKTMGIKTVRISLETTDQRLLEEMNRKEGPADFEKAIKNLFAAGFKKEELGVYLLAGIPGQSPESVKKAIDYVLEKGVTPRLAQYSPIPGTKTWEKAVKSARMDIKKDPLLQNNTVYFMITENWSTEILEELKHYLWNWGQTLH